MERIESEIIALSADDTFIFSCSKDVPCFNECCRNVNQVLMPYDILRLKNRLKISAGNFLQQYTTSQIGPETGLPVISFKTEYAKDMKCPFVTSSGCSIYEDRPSSCRTYPLARLVSRSKTNGNMTEQYMLLREPHCRGFENGRIWRVHEWVANQDIQIFNEMNDMLMDIIAIKKTMPGPMNIRLKHLFHIACYDIDEFRVQIFKKGLADYVSIDSDTYDAADHDDTSLLKISMKWIKQELMNG